MNPGEILAGKYIVERALGQGGMGAVVAGRHLQLGHRVAIKFLLPDAAQHHEAAARFLREGRAAVQIQSEHVARVSDVGTLDTGAPYMVMEFLDGRDLARVIAERQQPFPIQQAVDYVLQACEAIAEAHALGIVHRDLKPANLFLTHRADGSPLVKVLDFGISKLVASAGADANITATLAVLGSPAYMSPEQIRSAKNVDARTDIWSLGMILYELLAGQPAFQADSLSGLLATIIADAPVSLRARRSDIPAPLESVISRCLEKEPGKRMGSVSELAQALLPFSPPSTVSVERIRRVLQPNAGAPPLPLAVVAAASNLPIDHPARTATAHGWGSTAAGHSAARRKWLVAAIAVGVLGGVGIYFGLHTRDVVSGNVVRPSASHAAAAVSVNEVIPAASHTGVAPSGTIPPPVESSSPFGDAPPTVVPEAASDQIAPTEPVSKPAGKVRAPGGAAPSPTGPAVRRVGAAAYAPAHPKSSNDLFNDIN